VNGLGRKPKTGAQAKQGQRRAGIVRHQGATTGASSNDGTVAATPRTDEKTSRMVCHLTEIALVGVISSGVGSPNVEISGAILINTINRKRWLLVKVVRCPGGSLSVGIHLLAFLLSRPFNAAVCLAGTVLMSRNALASIRSVFGSSRAGNVEKMSLVHTFQPPFYSTGTILLRYELSV